MTNLDAYFAASNVPVSNGFDVGHFPEDVRPIIDDFCRVFPFTPPGRKSKRYSLWIREAREMREILGSAEPLAVFKKMQTEYTRKLHEGKAFDVAGIQSFVGPLRGLMARERMVTPVDGELVDAVLRDLLGVANAPDSTRQLATSLANAMEEADASARDVGAFAEWWRMHMNGAHMPMSADKLQAHYLAFKANPDPGRIRETDDEWRRRMFGG